MPSGNFKTESSGARLRGCCKLGIGNWELTEIKLAKKKRSNKPHKGERRKGEISQIRRYCWLTV